MQIQYERFKSSGTHVLGMTDNMCILFGTLAAFCVAQGLFWIYVGSKQFETVVMDKIEILKTFFENSSNKSLKFQFCRNLKSSITEETYSRITKIQEENIKMMWNRFSSFFIFTFSLFLLFGAISMKTYTNKISQLSDMNRQNEYAKMRGFFIGLFLILFSFSTEIFIFLYIIRPYVIIGDLEILEKVLN